MCCCFWSAKNWGAQLLNLTDFNIGYNTDVHTSEQFNQKVLNFGWTLSAYPKLLVMPLRNASFTDFLLLLLVGKPPAAAVCPPRQSWDHHHNVASPAGRFFLVKDTSREVTLHNPDQKVLTRSFYQ